MSVWTTMNGTWKSKTDIRRKMTPLTLAAGGDHAAFPLRGWLIELLRGHGYLPSTAQHPALSKAILATAKPPNAVRFVETAAIPSDNRGSESLLDSMIGPPLILMPQDAQRYILYLVGTLPITGAQRPA
jgi:hypothetical protein